MFNGGDSYTGNEYSMDAIFKIHRGSQVFAKPHYQDYLDKVKKVVNVKQKVFDELYVRLLYHYAEFVQSLTVPRDKTNGYLLDRQLRRAYGFAKYIAPKIMSHNGFGFDPDRMMYAMFSLALLHGCGRIFQDRWISLCEEDGQHIRQYFPVTGSMVGEYYRVVPMNSQPEDYVALMHGVYAQIIMPKMGYAWIAEDHKLFRWWLQGLENRDSGFSELDILFEFEKYDTGLLEALDFETQVLSQIPVELQAGEAFFAWLRDKIQHDQSFLMRDDNGLYHVEGELLVELDKVVDAYLASDQVSASKAAIISQFLSLGIAGESSHYRQTQQAGYLGKLSHKEFEACAIAYEKGVYQPEALGPLLRVESLAQISSGERFFTRIGGLAQQFMLGHTTKK